MNIDPENYLYTVTGEIPDLESKETNARMRQVLEEGNIVAISNSKERMQKLIDTLEQGGYKEAK